MTSALVRGCGCLVLSLIILAIPLLCGLSFALSWGSFFQWILMIFTAIDFLAVGDMINDLS